MSNQTATVLVVDDDAVIADLLRDFLEADGYSVVVAGDGATALYAIGTYSIDCIVLDIMMPGLSGFEVMRSIRETGDVPVLFLSALHEEHDKLRGLGLGADDYIVKSASPAEVVARVKAVLRRYRREESVTAHVLDFGRLKIDARAHEVVVDGLPMSLPVREFELLQLLANDPRQVFTRDQIFERLWGQFGDRHTVTVHVGRVREKIEQDPANPEYIVTVRGVGYRFEEVPR